MTPPSNDKNVVLPGLNCGMCGMRSCEALAMRLETDPELIKRCIYLSDNRVDSFHVSSDKEEFAVGESPVTLLGSNLRHLQSTAQKQETMACSGCITATSAVSTSTAAWQDSLGREFDFYLEHFPEDPGPREIILPHNPLITREMDVQIGDILIGRPLGMSCGCPITHCGVAMEVDKRTGVIVWCVTGPLNPRKQGFKDLGYYIAEGYEGLITEARTEIRIGMRYFFQPRRCMLQWRHSGLVNYLNHNANGYQVRIEGLWIG